MSALPQLQTVSNQYIVTLQVCTLSTFCGFCVEEKKAPDRRTEGRDVMDEKERLRGVFRCKPQTSHLLPDPGRKLGGLYLGTVPVLVGLRLDGAVLRPRYGCRER